MTAFLKSAPPYKTPKSIAGSFEFIGVNSNLHILRLHQLNNSLPSQNRHKKPPLKILTPLTKWGVGRF